MLEEIFTSNTRVKVMELFLANQEKEFYLREISRKLGENTNSVRRELNNLHNIGFLKRRKKGNLVLYSADRDFPIYNELKNIFMKTRGAVKLIADSLKDLEGVMAAFIYGSFARGEERADSDIDIFVVGRVEENDLLKRIKRVEDTLKREINYVVFSLDEFRKGNPFIEEVLSKPKMMLLGDLDGDR